jgi:hypothetical protein
MRVANQTFSKLTRWYRSFGGRLFYSDTSLFFVSEIILKDFLFLLCWEVMSGLI